MSDEPEAGDQANAGEEPAPSNWGEMLDERTHWRFWMPRYIVGAMAEQLGQRGLALYASLAWWMCRDAPHHRPGLKEIGQRAGCSRSTVWRGLKDLVAARVIRIEPCVGRNGRRAHRIVLTHPPEAFAYERLHGTEIAGGSNLTPPRAQDERAEVSNCARGALKLSAPSRSNSDLSVCVTPPAADTHTDLPPANSVTCGYVSDFVRAWMAALPPGAKRWRKDHREEAREWGARLLAMGWTVDQLCTDINDAGRDPAEWPRVYAARHGPAALRARQKPIEATAERQARAQATQEAAEWARAKADNRARFDALPPEERQRWVEEVRRRHPRIGSHLGILRGMAADLAAESAAADTSPGSAASAGGAKAPPAATP